MSFSELVSFTPSPAQKDRNPSSLNTDLLNSWCEIIQFHRVDRSHPILQPYQPPLPHHLPLGPAIPQRNPAMCQKEPHAAFDLEYAKCSSPAGLNPIITLPLFAPLLLASIPITHTCHSVLQSQIPHVHRNPADGAGKQVIPTRR
jgi:hypothetical protein